MPAVIATPPREQTWRDFHVRAFSVASAADQAFLEAVRTETGRLLETGASFPEGRRALEKVISDHAAGGLEP